MNKELKFFIEDNFDFLVRLYNRYIRYSLRRSNPIEYYASPYMNLVGYPSDEFILFCTKYFNKKYQKNIMLIIIKKSFIIKLYQYIRLIIIFVFSSFVFKKKINKNSVIVHGFHSDDNFKYKQYRTIKTPPLEYFKEKYIYHDINISFISFKSFLKYKKNNIICSINTLNIIDFLKLHYLALKIFVKNKQIDFFPISYVDILYTLVKGVSISNIINDLDKKSFYIHMFENRGHQLITDLLVTKENKLIYLDLGIMFRLAPEYMMFNYLKHNLHGKFIFMSEYNYNLIKKNLNLIEYKFFKNYRIDCKNYNIKGKKHSILIIGSLSMDISKKLYQLLLDNLDSHYTIKLRLHPFINKSSFNNRYLEDRNIYDSLSDYDTIVYTGITSASVELYFQSKKVYKIILDDFIDIDMLVDNGLIKKIRTLSEIGYNEHYLDIRKTYYLGCDNKSLDKILEEFKL